MSSLVKGSLLIAVGTIYKILVTILIDKLLATELGPDDFGKYKYGVTIVLLLSTFCTLGFNTSIVRGIAIQNTSEHKRFLITASLLLTMITAILVAVVGLVTKMFNIAPSFLFATLFFAINTLYSSIYSGLEKPALKAWINDIFGFTFYLVFLWAYFQLSGESDKIALVYLFYTISVFVTNLLFSRKLFITINKKRLFEKEFKDFIKYSKPLFGVSLLIILSTNVDKVVLNLFVPLDQLGVYYAVFNISNLLPLILTIFVFMYLPRISKFLQQGKLKKATLISSYSSKWTMIMASIFFGAIFFYAEEIVRLLYTEEFIEGVWVLKILAFAQWINVSLGFTGQNLLALGDSKRQLFIRTFSFLIGAILLFFGAKYYGNVGAAISVLVSLLCSNLMQIAILKSKHGFLGYRKQNVYSFCVVLLSGIVLTYLHKLDYHKNWNFLILIFIDLCIFVLLLLLTRVLGKKDVRVLKVID